MKENTIKVLSLLILLGGVYFFKLSLESKFRSTELPREVYSEPSLAQLKREQPESKPPQKIYSVGEVASLLKKSPEQLSGQELYIDAYVADTLLGKGCNNFAVLTDPSHAALYKRSAASDLTEEEKKAISEIPVIRAGQLTGLLKVIYPTAHVVLKGRFNASSMQHCPDGPNRFKIEEVEKDLRADSSGPA